MHHKKESTMKRFAMYLAIAFAGIGIALAPACDSSGGDKKEEKAKDDGAKKEEGGDKKDKKAKEGDEEGGW